MYSIKKLSHEERGVQNLISSSDTGYIILLMHIYDIVQLIISIQPAYALKAFLAKHGIHTDVTQHRGK